MSSTLPTSERDALPSRRVFADVAGFIETCEADEHGLVGALLLLTREAHKDLVALDREGMLGMAGLCLVQTVSARVSTTPWGVVTADVDSADGVSLDFSSCP